MHSLPNILRSRYPPENGALLSMRLVQVILGLAALAFLALHYLHLSADFPDGTPWMDWAKYTDEGWYGDAAIRLFTRGHWRVPGDFNPAVALPVWPTLEAILFRLTGVSVVAARALSVSIFLLIAFTAAALVQDALHRLAPRRSPYAHPTPIPRTAALITLLLLASSSFCFAFSRLAILEHLCILLGLVALRVAIRLGLAIHLGDRTSISRAVLLGLLLVLMVLTKTTSLSLAPSVLVALWAAAGWRLRRAVPPALTALATALVLWLLYYGLFVRPHLLADYQYLFNANAYTGITRATALSVLHDTLRDIAWIGMASALAALCAIPLGLALPRLRRDPLFPALLVWLFGYTAFLAYHDNLQPRYYLVLAIPLLVLPTLSLGALLLTSPSPPAAGLARLGVLLLLVLAVHQSLLTLRFVRNPTYRFVTAAQGIASIIRSDPRHRPLLLSISGSDISLMTGIHSICDDFGSIDLEDRIDLYRPGWYAAWNHVEDDKMDDLAPAFQLERVAAFPAYDDPERNLLILYRLDTPGEHKARLHRRPPVPPQLRTRSGQQPSFAQLRH